MKIKIENIIITYYIYNIYNMDNNWKIWKKVEYFDEKGTTFHQNKLNLLFNLHKINSKNYSVLEVGSGHGRYTIIFQKLFKKILALDLESELIDLLNNKISEKGFNNISTIRSNFEDFKINNKFDMILFTQSLLWISDKQKAILKCDKLLKKNGYLMIIEPIGFLNNLNKNKPNNLLIQSLNTIICSKKFTLVHFFTLGLRVNDQIIYLLKKN